MRCETSTQKRSIAGGGRGQFFQELPIGGGRHRGDHAEWLAGGENRVSRREDDRRVQSFLEVESRRGAHTVPRIPW